MPVTSPVSAVEPRAEGEVLPLKVARIRRASPRALWPEVAAKLMWRGFAPLLHRFRRSWFYRQTLRGFMPDRIVYQPDDPRPKKLDDADALMRGRFRFAGRAVELKEGSIFDAKLPSAEFVAALHGFEWLRHLEAAGGDLARGYALKLTQQWLKRYAQYSLPAWEPAITAERLFNIFTHGRFFLANTDMVWRSRFFLSVRDQAGVLSRSIDEAPEGLPRLKAAAVLALAGFCLGDSGTATLGLKSLALEIEQQILPDGGHIGRSPEAALDAFRLLNAVQDALEAAGRVTQVSLRSALDRMGPMLAFFRMGDNTLPVFNGGTEGNAVILSQLLARNDEAARPLGQAANSGYQRLASSRTLVILDAGCPPPGAQSVDAHAGCLSFEMSSGEHRMIVNCGTALGHDPEWELALRGTAAHSTLTLDDISQGTVLTEGMFARMLGPRLMGGASTVEIRRTQGTHGLSVEATQDAYVPRFGLLHQRRLMLGPKGVSLAGADRLMPVESKAWAKLSVRARRDGIPFAIRFHVHPDVRLSMSQTRGSVILKLPSGEGWRFRCGGGTLSIDESIYFGGGFPRRAEQLVITGLMTDQATEAAWVFEQTGTA